MPLPSSSSTYLKTHRCQCCCLVQGGGRWSGNPRFRADPCLPEYRFVGYVASTNICRVSRACGGPSMMRTILRWPLIRENVRKPQHSRSSSIRVPSNFSRPGSLGNVKLTLPGAVVTLTVLGIKVSLRNDRRFSSSVAVKVQHVEGSLICLILKGNDIQVKRIWHHQAGGIRATPAFKSGTVHDRGTRPTLP